MGTVLAYFIKTGCCLAVFYLFYKWLLSKDTFHHFNRFVLISLLLISAALPFVQINLHTTIQQAQFMIGNLMMEVVDETNSTPTFQWQWLLIITYLTGCLCYATITLISYLKLYKTIHYFPSKTLTDNSRIRLILTNKDVSCFSWMNYIVISKTDYKENGDAIITHEKAHIHYMHSIDILIADICIMFQWFNPAAWLIKKELQNIHEFEADEAVLKAGICAKNYQLLLIKKAVGTRLYSMANSFNHSSLKKRITMMLKRKSNPWARLKYAYILPLAAISVATLANAKVSEPLNALSEVKVSDLSDYLIQKSEKSNAVAIKTPYLSLPETQKPQKKIKFARPNIVYDMVEKQPEYPGGVAAMLRYLSANIKYPTSAKQKGVEGKVIVQFVVDRTGTIRDCKVLRSIDTDLDKEAIRVVRNMPKWTPGMQKGEKVSVKYTLPISFQLGKNKQKTSTAEHSNEIYEMVEEMPEFQGGRNAMMMYLGSHLKYPVEASKAGIEGKVICQFTVGKDGKISDISVVRPVNEYLDKEAIRVISSMPKWKPGKTKGENVAVKYTLPIYFSFDGSNSKIKNNKTDNGVQVITYK